MSVTLTRATDTMTVDMVVLPNDTTAPRVIRAEGRDSLQVRIFSDDWLEPAAPLAAISVRILALPDSSEITGPHRLMHPDSFTAMVRARAEAALRDSARADSIRRAAGDTTVRRTPPRPPAGQAVGQIGGRQGGAGQAAGGAATVLPPIGPLPYQELVVIPNAPLKPGNYLIVVNGLMNINQRFGGGGTAPFEITAPQPVKPDTTQAAMPLRPAQTRQAPPRRDRSAP
jgi:hypothetical protein